MESALIAMSGGVDSSVAALLTLNKGFKCVGAMMKLFQNPGEEIKCDKSCCSLDDSKDARAVAFNLGIPFYVFNFKDEFKKRVIDNFVYSYQTGKTPNPCIECNKYLKFDKMLKRAFELGLNYVVTGHYARIEYDSGINRYLLKKGLDHNKDQSYVLYSMTQNQLKHTIFPLGSLTKQEVRKIAEENGFVNAHKSESQDICFVPDGKYVDFIKDYTDCSIGFEPGDFVDESGKVIGTHKGIVNYTVGQRKGLGISAKHPLYVCKIDKENNNVILGCKESLYSKKVFANNINLISESKLNSSIKVTAKLRYKQEEQPAVLHRIDDNTICVEFDSPQRAAAKGQALVLYQGDIVVGGGTII